MRILGQARYLRLGSSLVALCLLLPARGRVTARATADTGRIAAVDAVSMVVSDMDRSVDFFTSVLTFEKVTDVEVAGDQYERLEGLFGVRMRVVRLRLGDERLELMQFVAPEGRPVPVDSRSNDRWFQHVAIIVSDMEPGIRAPAGAQGPARLDRPAAAAGLEPERRRHRSVLLQGSRRPRARDPRVSAGQGRGRNGIAPTDRLFLGIDHTAIVVGDTDRSLAVLPGRAGAPRRRGERELRHRAGAAEQRLRRPPANHRPHRRRRAGHRVSRLSRADQRRPAPTDTRTNDLIAWQTRLLTDRVEALSARLSPGTFGFISPGAVSLAQPTLGFSRGALVRDPDGHAVMLAEK